MQIHNLQQFLINKINLLEIKLSSALQSGDVNLYSDIEKELEETKESLLKISSLG